MNLNVSDLIDEFEKANRVPQCVICTGELYNTFHETAEKALAPLENTMTFSILPLMDKIAFADAVLTAIVHSFVTGQDAEQNNVWKQGYDEGYEEGWKEGRDEGYEEGYEEGYAASIEVNE